LIRSIDKGDGNEGTVVRSKLFLRLFSTMILAVGLFSSAIYLFSVPLIAEKAYEIELNASRTILDNVFEMASRINGNLEDTRNITVESYKQQFRNIVSIASAYIDYVYDRRDRGEISGEEADRLVSEGLRSFRYGNNDYIWLTDYNSVLMSHPDPYFQGRNSAELRDMSGQLILPTIIRIAREQGEGFHTYSWRRPDNGQNAEKISYFKNMPHRGLIVGSGAFLADIDEEVARRKAVAVDELRKALHNIRIARTGYVYIFDASNNMIIHPNPNIEGTEFGRLLDPATGHPISEELKIAADRDRPFSYLWDKPSDPGNYAYEKISWVRHFRGFDWYIASSVYVDELRRSSVVLGDRILIIAIAIMVLASTFGYFGARRLVRPINRLAETAVSVRSGNLNAESGIVRDDEIGVLAAAFDGMIRRVRDNIATLDTRVRERTAALEQVNLRLRDAVESQRRVQAVLAETEARQRLILDAIPASIAYLGRDERIRFANRRWAAMVHMDKDALIGRSLRSVVEPRAYAHFVPHIERTLAGGETTFEYSYTGSGRRVIVTKNSLIPETAPDGETVGLFVLSLDITDEKETERHLMEAQRLKAVGQLSGGLAHDFNNLLSIILGNLGVVREKYAAVEGLDAFLEPAERASRRGADITARLLAFARRQPLKPVAVEAGTLVRDTAVLLRRSFPSNIEIVEPDGDTRCWTFADPGQLENALVNLALNARDAMPHGGRLDIAMGCPTIGAGVMFDEPVVPGDYVEIRVRDTGIGFAPDALVQAFEPFFTTKELGSGLGLSMVYGFVKQSRGYIQLDSVEGCGTTVTILLPQAQPVTASALAGPEVARADPRWTGQLALVAEDNDDVRQVIRRQLVDLGFSVIETESGDEAMELIGQIEGLDLVVSDIVMPGLSGIDLAHRVRRMRPEINVVLISGFSIEDTDNIRDLVILRKPWEKQDLIDAIRRQADEAATV
jgi:two-component system cell cycle sensor histidine kinase/response regulator CckA